MVDNGAVKLGEWDYSRYAIVTDPRHALLSRGFLRCRPAGWFPGFTALWQTLAHSFSGTVKVLDVTPEPFCEAGPKIFFGGTINSEPFGVLIDSVSEVILLDAMLPYGSDKARAIALEYLARRLFATMAETWSGPTTTKVEFRPDIKRDNIREAGAVRMRMNMNGQECTIWVSLGGKIVEQIDGLWRRQVRSSASANIAGLIEVEVAQLAVPPQMISDYTRPGTIIDLETPLSDHVTLRISGRAWVAAKLRNINGKLGLETTVTPPQVMALPEGTKRIGIQFGAIEIDTPMAAEISQPGAVVETGWPVSAAVALIVDNEEIAQGVLKTYEGRLAVQVR